MAMCSNFGSSFCFHCALHLPSVLIMTKFARFDVWARAQICTLKEEGVPVTEIVKRVKRNNGKLATIGAIQRVLWKKRENPEAWVLS